MSASRPQSVLLVEKLRKRAADCRAAGFVFYDLPPLAQTALYGIAAELDDAVGLVEQLEAYESALREIADIDLTAHQTRSGAHSYRQTREFARKALNSAISPCEHVWEYPWPTLDSNPPLYARRCEVCSLVQYKNYGDWEESAPANDLQEQLEALDETLRDILDVTEKWTRQMSDAERLTAIAWRAKEALRPTSTPASEPKED